MEAAQLQSKVCVQSSHVQEPQKPKNLGWGSMEVYNKKIYIYIWVGGLLQTAAPDASIGHQAHTQRRRPLL